MDRVASDEEVMRRLADGEAAALAVLMQRWHGRVWCFVRRLCRSDGADDVCQDIWLRLYRYRRRYDGRRPFAPYLFAIATNCCKTVGARDDRRRRRERSLDADPPPAALSDRPQPLDSLISREDSQALRRAIGRLPDMQRAVVLLYLLCSADYAEVAGVLNRQVSTVRSHMHHAVKALRASLDRMRRSSESRVDYERST